jgi:hypothetical protein
MAFYTGILNRMMGITRERIAEAMEETTWSNKLKECINRINTPNPKAAITAAVEANKELASWAGIERTELSSLQKEEFMSREELRKGVEGINRRAMKHIHQKLSGIESIRRLERRDEGLLINITRKMRQLSDILVSIEKTASNLAHLKEEDHEQFARFDREHEVAKAELNSTVFLLTKHIKTIKDAYTMEKRLVPAHA